MADVVAVMARLDGDSGGMVDAFERSQDSMTRFGRTVDEQSDSAAKSVKKMDEDSGSSFADFAKKAAGAAAGVVAAGALIGSAFDQVNIKGTIAAQFAGTPEQVNAIGKATSAAYNAGWGDSLDEVSKTATGLEQALDRVGQSGNLTELTKQAQALSSTFDVDTSESIASVNNLLATGMAPNAQAAFDILTKGLQSGANASGDLIDTFTEYPAQFQKLGLDGSTAMGLINQGMAAGARNTDLVADALKEFSIRAVDGSTTTAAGFKALGLNATEMAETISKGGASASGGLQTVLDKLRGIKDPVAQSQAAVELFGTQAEDLGKSLYSLDPSKAVDALGKVGGAAKAMTENTMSVQQQLEGMGRTLMSGLGKALAPIVPVFEDAVKEITPILGGIGGAVAPVITAVMPLFTRLSSAIQPFIATLGSAMAPVLKVLKSSLKEITPILQPLASGFIAITSSVLGLLPQITPLISQLLPPLVGIIGQLAPVVSTLASVVAVQLQTAFSAIKPALSDVFAAVASIIPVFTQVASVLIQSLIPIVPALVKGFTAIVSAVLPLISPILDLVTAFMPLISVIAKLIAAILPPVIALLVGLLGPILSLVTPLVDMLAPAIQQLADVLSVVIGWVGSFVTTLTGGAGIVANVGKAIGDVFTWLYNSAIKPAISGITGVIGAVVGYVSNQFAGMIGIARSVGGAFQDVFGAVGRVISGAFTTAVGGVKSGINGVIGIVNGAIRALNGLHVSIPAWVPGVGGQTFGVSLPTIPMLARGGTVLGGGLALVGEKGPEVVSLPAGASVTPAYPSAQALADMADRKGGGVTFNNDWHVTTSDPVVLAKMVNQTMSFQLDAAGAMQ